MSCNIVKYLIPVVIFLFSADIIFPQEKEIEAKKNQLSNIKKEISSLESQLNNKSNKEKESFTAIDNYSRQSFLLNKIIAGYRKEEKQKDEQISESEDRITVIGETIKALQDNYAKYIRAIYKHGQPDNFEMVVNSASVQQALLRLKYLDKFSEQRRKDVAELENSREQLIIAKETLKAEKKEKEKLTSEKAKEETSLLLKLSAQKKVLNIIRHDKSGLKKEIEERKKAEIKIRDLITRLVAEAEKKKKEEAERLAHEKLKRDVKTSEVSIGIESENPDESGYDVNLSTEGFAAFSSRKGKLNWPVTGGKIVRRFGENKNNKTKTVMLNYGIDIAAGKDLNVKAVSEGVVSAIDWIPGYGSVIILTHKEDYRTVYSHVSEIYVNEGDKVKTGNIIAKIGDSVEGQVLHFEIWNSRQIQNPEVWLTKR